MLLDDSVQNVLDTAMSTLKSLAGQLGLSITTVSRALDGYDDVAPGTRERVRRAAEAAGYLPNAAARRLRRGTTEIVTLVLPAEPGRFNEPFYIELLAAMGPHVARAGYDLTLVAAPPGADELRTLRRLVEGRRTDGLILVRARWQDPRVEYLVKMRFPFVLLGRTGEAGRFAFIDGDGEAGFDRATRELARLGHRRIAHAASPPTLTYARLRRAGYERAMAALGLAPEVAECVSADEAGGALAARALFSLRWRPTAIIAATDRIAFGILSEARAMGIRVPDDLSVIGHDNLPQSAFSDPPLTTMELPLDIVGGRLAGMLIERIGGADPAAMQEILPLATIARGTVGPAPR